MGQALWDFYDNNAAEDLVVYSDIGETEYWPPGYFFRAYNLMPAIEQKALQSCKGTVLDIGAGAGCHVRELIRSGFNTFALEKDPVLAGMLREKEFSGVWEADFFNFTPPRGFDTLLLLMNGIGICGTLEGLRNFLRQVGYYLNPGGQILLDSSDLSLLFDEADKAQREQDNQTYYGEVRYQLEYRGIKGNPIDWLFIDPETLKQIAGFYGYHVTILARDQEGQYLAKLTADATA